MNRFVYSAIPVVQISLTFDRFAGEPGQRDEDFMEEFKAFLTKENINPVNLPAVTPYRGGTYSGLFAPEAAVKIVEWLESKGVGRPRHVTTNVRIHKPPSALPMLKRFART